MNPLNKNNVYEPECHLDSSPRDYENRRSLREAHFDIKCRNDMYKFSSAWANDPAVREALHIHKGSREKWKRCNYDVNTTADLTNVILYHKDLSRRGGYRSLIYSGTADSIVPTLSTEAWIKSLDYPIVDQWRAWLVDGQCAGYTRSYANNMTFASGGGHVAPEYKPKECQAMLKRWISHAPL
ncbi:hypothetical protein M569_10950 [Genlisea aurea]|uniref:Uncharacterized protein n=1 Tax=Genlisea aurea TaxID=192259 RepID=S8CAI2_9LAMI|nr:hypothetical protein M569_10950 [Genlisea aurea]